MNTHNLSSYNADELRIHNSLRNYETGYRIALLSGLALATIGFIPAVFIIFYKSTNEMKKYKWCLLNILVTSYLFELLLCAWLPVPMFRLFGGYNIGIFYQLPLEANYVFLTFLLFIFVNLLLSFLNFLLYQTMNSKIASNWEIFSSPKMYAFCYLFIWLIFGLAMAVPLWIASVDEASFETARLIDYPTMRLFFENEKVFGFLFSSSIFIVVFFILIFMVYFILVVLLNIKIICNISFFKSHVTKKVWNLQKELYLTFLFQTVFSIFSFFGPILFIFISAALDDSKVYMRSTTGVIIMSTQCPVCSLILIFSIKPYRKFVKSLFIKRAVVHNSGS